jgi:hypothetical protein
MRKIESAIQLSASDLVGHLNCRYLTGLDIAVANGKLAKPIVWDPSLELLAERDPRSCLYRAYHGNRLQTGYR